MLLVLSSTTSLILNKCFSLKLIFLQRAHLQFCIVQDRTWATFSVLKVSGLHWWVNCRTSHRTWGCRLEGIFLYSWVTLLVCCCCCWGFFSHQVASGHDFHLHVVFVAVSVASLQNLDAVQFSSTQQPSSQGLILNEASILNRYFIAQSYCMGKQSLVVLLRYGCRKWFNAYIHEHIIKQFTQD